MLLLVSFGTLGVGVAALVCFVALQVGYLVPRLHLRSCSVLFPSCSW